MVLAEPAAAAEIKKSYPTEERHIIAFTARTL
jgi:hypothetical protein